jgi:hypothetical protein
MPLVREHGDSILMTNRYESWRGGGYAFLAELCFGQVPMLQTILEQRRVTKSEYRRYVRR